VILNVLAASGLLDASFRRRDPEEQSRQYDEASNRQRDCEDG
jgi:hypothetical protein